MTVSALLFLNLLQILFLIWIMFEVNKKENKDVSPNQLEEPSMDYKEAIKKNGNRL